MDKKKKDLIAKIGVATMLGGTAYNLFSACLTKRQEQTGNFAVSFPEIENEINEVIAKEREKREITENE